MLVHSRQGQLLHGSICCHLRVKAGLQHERGRKGRASSTVRGHLRMRSSQAGQIDIQSLQPQYAALAIMRQRAWCLFLLTWQPGYVIACRAGIGQVVISPHVYHAGRK